MKRLQGKVALVTGAGNGMGQATTKRFLEKGVELSVDLGMAVC
jgi:NAD(P)-dependent dehydrogenase (short-subunit alcohol dehydrogenase family)